MLIDYFTNQHGSKAHYIITCHKAINIVKGREICDTQIHERPTIFADNTAKLLFD